MKHLLFTLCLLPSICLAQIATGTLIITKKTETGYGKVELAPTANQMLQMDASGGLILSTDGSFLTALNASNISSGSLALGRLAQGGATTGQVLAWTGSAWAAQDAAAGGVQDSDDVTWTGDHIFSGGVELSNGTSPTELHVYNTKTSGTNYERGFIGFRDDKLVIGTEAGASGGSQRNLRFETGTGFVTFTGALDVQAANGVKVAPNAYIWWFDRVSMKAPGDGVLFLSNVAETDFGLIQLGGATSAFPAIKRSSAKIQARLADDSAFTNIQGKLTTDTNATTGTITPDKYLIFYDSAGTAYRVPCVAD